MTGWKIAGGEQIRTAASRQKPQGQEMIVSVKKPGFPGFFILGLLRVLRFVT